MILKLLYWPLKKSQCPETLRDQASSGKTGHRIICYVLDRNPLLSIYLQILSHNKWLTHLYFLAVSFDEKKGFFMKSIFTLFLKCIISNELRNICLLLMPERYFHYIFFQKFCCLVVEPCPTLCNLMDCHLSACLFITISCSWLKLMFTELVMPSSHLILCCPLLLLPSIFPSIRVLSNELSLHIRWPRIGNSASASVLPMNIQD